MKKPRKPIGKKIIKDCEQCNNSYSPFPYKNETSRFCGIDCYYESKKQPIQVCKECGSGFCRDRKASYCSKQCSSKNSTPPPKRLSKGENHPGVRIRMKKLGLTWEEYSDWRDSKKKYYKEVWRITKEQDITILENNDKIRTRAGIEGGYQLDHVVSIAEGWRSKINPYIIGNIKNLQMLTWEQNLKKRDK